MTKQWMIDSEASSHITNQRNSLVDYKEYERPELVKLGDGRSVEAMGHGSVRLEMLFKISEFKPATHTKVLCVPKLSCNLFLVRAGVTMGNTAKLVTPSAK